MHTRAAPRVVVVATAALLVLSGVGTSLASSGAAATNATYLSMLNAERTRQGLAPLQLRADLSAAAHAWATQMADAGRLSHNPDLVHITNDWQSIGENVGEGPDIQDLNSAFYASAPHRANILDQHYEDIGIGSVRRDGTIWISVVFLQPRPVKVAVRRPAAPQPQQQAEPVADTHPMVGFGSVGPAVARVQRLLDVLVDGVFGVVTRHAVVGFQRQHHLAPDGIVGPNTWAALLAHRLGVPA